MSRNATHPFLASGSTVTSVVARTLGLHAGAASAPPVAVVGLKWKRRHARGKEAGRGAGTEGQGESNISAPADANHDTACAACSLGQMLTRSAVYSSSQTPTKSFSSKSSFRACVAHTSPGAEVDVPHSEFSNKDLKSVGNYSLGRLIGKGSFGKVYLATHKLTNGSKVRRDPVTISALRYISFAHENPLILTPFSLNRWFSSLPTKATQIWLGKFIIIASSSIHTSRDFTRSL